MCCNPRVVEYECRDDRNKIVKENGYLLGFGQSDTIFAKQELVAIIENKDGEIVLVGVNRVRFENPAYDKECK